MKRLTLSLMIAAALALAARAQDGAPVNAKLSPELEEPIRLEAGGKPIDTDVGHAAPFVCDWFGEGKRDLLVGQFGDGVLWIYKNVGTNAEPRFAKGVKFKNGEKDGVVPTG